MANTSKFTPEAFIKLWQTSESIREVAEKTGLTPGGANSRAQLYRKNGVQLKRFPKGSSGPRLDYKSLAKLPAIVLQQVHKSPELFGYNAGAQLARLCSPNAADSDRGEMRAAKLAEAFGTGELTFKWLKEQCDAFLAHKPRAQARTGVSLRYPEGYLRGRGDTLQLELRLGAPEKQEALLEELRQFLRERGIVENPADSEASVVLQHEAAD